MSADLTIVAAQRLQALAGTAWVHTLALLLCAAALHRVLRHAAPAALERLWWTALLGGLLTACAVFFLMGMPVQLRPEAPQPSALASLPSPDQATAFDPSTTPVVSAMRSNHSSTFSATHTPEPLGEARDVWSWVFSLWVGFVAVFAVRELAARWHFWRHLRGRRPVADTCWTQSLETIAQRARWQGRPVRLTTCPSLASPIAFGRRRPEICVPMRALGELSEAERDAMLAHELAHLERRDASRQTRARWLAVLTLQPLGPLALRRLRDLAELQCDARSIELTGHPGALARCLARVAGWISGPARPLASRMPFAPAMARPGAALEARMRCLVEAPAPRRRRLVYGLALGAVLLVGWLAPRMTVTVPVWAASGAIPLHEVRGEGLPALDDELSAAEAELAELVALARAQGPNATRDAVLTRIVGRVQRLRVQRTQLAIRIEGEK